MSVHLEPPVTIAGVTLQLEVETRVRARAFGAGCAFTGEKVPRRVRIGDGADAVWVEIGPESKTPAGEAGVEP